MKTLTLLLLLISLPVSAARLHYEKYYQDAWCTAEGGEMEHVLPGRTRVDCLTHYYAVEVDFADKWAEGMGQAAYYAAMTGKYAALLLIIESPKDTRYVDRVMRAVTLRNTPITVYTITPEEAETIMEALERSK